MLHASVADRYVGHRTIFLRLLRMAFAAAGTYWILLYLLPLETHAALRSGQSIIYFILLSLWGFDYMREQKRLAVIIEAANSRNIPPRDVTLNDVEKSASLFSMFIPRSGFGGTVLPVLFITGLISAWILIIRQYVLAFSSM